MLVKLYNCIITLFYLYIAYRGALLIFVESENKKFESIIYQYGLENKNKYLSIWVSLLQTLYFILVSTTDIIDCCSSVLKWAHLSRDLKTLKYYLLTSLVLPLTMYIFVVFWTFFLYDREMIYPELFDRFIPPWLNHAMHSWPLPILLTHLVLSPNHNPPFREALTGLTALFLAYGISFGSSVMKGNWIYLLFNHLNPSQKLYLLMTSYPLNILFLILSRWINYYVGEFKKRHSRGYRRKNN